MSKSVDYQRMEYNTPNLLTPETILLNQQIINNTYESYKTTILSTLNNYCQSPIYNKKLFLAIVPKNYNRYDQSSINYAIYHKVLRPNNMYGIVKYKFSKRNYRKLYVTLFNPTIYQRKIIKSISKLQRSDQTEFYYNKLYFFSNIRKIYADYHNYGIALRPYGYTVSLESNSYDGYYINISL